MHIKLISTSTITQLFRVYLDLKPLTGLGVAKNKRKTKY